MSEAKHTPGPWRVIGKGTAIWADAEIIAQSSFSRSAPAVAHANSLLMAAAPDLLEVAKLYIEHFEKHHITNTHGARDFDFSGHIAAVCRAAIAKATGVTE